ncbi:hypothetical protein [Pseudoduganella chitinolytica]|uniref:DUF4148 domain-containing protein n=1 Tax=Pseudoduganella chitinolytica TaxID=34070 RepID=A0ABY8BDD5_9BURK|nr:hypothetical protein [Pseudoduganella chitinolytica]WEF33716.1 hypothetical protein PX653_02685 [Pseudoduganella chitinolytica]
MSKRANNRSKANGAAARAHAAGWLAAVACAAGLALALPASANPGDGPQRRDDRGQQNQQQNRRDFRDSRWGDAAEQRAFEARAEEQRRIMQENANNAEMNRRMSRMTADERRDLRRQINEAGQEVYSLTPRR